MRLAFCFVVFHSFVWYPCTACRNERVVFQQSLSNQPMQPADDDLGDPDPNHVSIPLNGHKHDIFLFVGW